MIVFSSFVTPAIGEKCNNLGADAVFPKSELEQLLQSICEQRPGGANPK